MLQLVSQYFNSTHASLFLHSRYQLMKDLIDVDSDVEETASTQHKKSAMNHKRKIIADGATDKECFRSNSARLSVPSIYHNPSRHLDKELNHLVDETRRMRLIPPFINTTFPSWVRITYEYLMTWL